MHRCICCDTPCACGGDVAPALSEAERPDCTHCDGCCDHGMPFGLTCSFCDTEGFQVEENAPAARPTLSLNGGW